MSRNYVFYIIVKLPQRLSDLSADDVQFFLLNTHLLQTL